MRVSSIHLTNFKRFTDLSIRDLPESAKLVVVVGPNGCGKSSLFDAFLQWHQTRGVKINVGIDETYLKKTEERPFALTESVEISLHGGAEPQVDSLYVRTAHRNDPDFSVTNLSRPMSPIQPEQFRRQRRLIDDDKSVSENYHRLVYETMSALYDQSNDNKYVAQLRDELIGNIRRSMVNVFGDLVLNNIADPLGSGSFYFDKGTARSYHFKNLSGGEKAAFDILLDMHIKKGYFTQAIYCIDEIETHLHTQIQGSLLREITDIIPKKSQLWITTHSLGVLRAAQEMEKSDSGSVCIIDFDGVDTDKPCELVPVTLDRVTWQKMLSVTLDDLSSRISPEYVVVCEGSSVGNRRKDFDADIYNGILGNRTPGLLFVAGGSSNQIKGNSDTLRNVLQAVLPQTKIVALVDRDDKSDAEVEKWTCNGDLVLPERNLESFLLADDVLEALASNVGKADQFSDVLRIKADAIKSSIARGNASDDFKSAAGEMYVGIKSLLNLQRAGNDTDAFLRDTLAPLVVPGMSTYHKLESAIVDKLAKRD